MYNIKQITENKFIYQIWDDTLKLFCNNFEFFIYGGKWLYSLPKDVIVSNYAKENIKKFIINGKNFN